ncbi:unnamed protein product [Amoebophrya sp. A120]|nr:unnamed protein product [Amoebophrya sp. A120]|eukprot:GSA120T00001748001.1
MYQRGSTPLDEKVCSTNQVVLLVGLPAAGKSSLCARLQREIGDRARLVLHEYDKLEQELSTVFDPEKWREARGAVVTNVRNALAGEKGRDPDDGVIKKCTIHLLDDNFYLRSMRKPFFQLAREFRCQYKTITFRAGLESCLLRNAQRQGRARVPDAILLNMAEVLEAPTSTATSRGSTWEKHVVNLDYGDMNEEDAAGSTRVEDFSKREEGVQKPQSLPTTSFEEVVEFILTSTPDAVPKPEQELFLADKDKDSDSSAAALGELKDLLESRCRKLISLSLETAVDATQKQMLAKQLGVAKKDIAARLKSKIQSEHVGTAESTSSIESLHLFADELCDEFQRICRSKLQDVTLSATSTVAHR